MERSGLSTFMLETWSAKYVWYDGKNEVFDFSNGKDVWDGKYTCVNENDNENKNGFLYRQVKIGSCCEG